MYVVQVHDGSYTPTDQFRRDPDSLCSTVSWRDEEDRVIWVYKIQVCGGGGSHGRVPVAYNAFVFSQRSHMVVLECQRLRARCQLLVASM